jgi:hypothetical protein
VAPTYPLSEADALLIAAARNALPLLLDVVGAARTLLAPDPDGDVLPDEDWAPEFLVLRAALARLDSHFQEGSHE